MRSSLPNVGVCVAKDDTGDVQDQNQVSLSLTMGSPLQITVEACKATVIAVKYGRSGVGNMSKNHRFYAVVGSVLCVCLFLYWPLLLTFRPPIGLDWRMNRNLRIYVRPENQTALIVGEGACSSDHGFPLVVVVCSAVPNVEARRAIRETWGSAARGGGSYNNHSLPARLVFLLGRSENDTSQEDIQRESDTYGDIIQEDFLDTYNNLTLKSVMLLKWVESSCPRAKYVMKTDDDMFVNIPTLLAVLAQKGKPKLLIGSLICNAIPIKDKTSKWYAPNSLFSERVYPNYLSGTGYVMSRDLVPLFYQTALETPFFHMEDIYITGICARKLKLKPQDHLGFSYQKRAFSVCMYRKIITSHRMTPADLRRIWRDMKKSVKCDNKKKSKLREYRPTHCH